MKPGGQEIKRNRWNGSIQCSPRRADFAETRTWCRDPCETVLSCTFWAIVEMLILMSWGCDGGSPLHFGPAPRGAGAFADHDEPPGRTECFSGLRLWVSLLSHRQVRVTQRGPCTGRSSSAEPQMIRITQLGINRGSQCLPQSSSILYSRGPMFLPVRIPWTWSSRH